MKFKVGDEVWASKRKWKGRVTYVIDSVFYRIDFGDVDFKTGKQFNLPDPLKEGVIMWCGRWEVNLFKKTLVYRREE